jgi:tetracycline resistance efflux pump
VDTSYGFLSVIPIIVLLILAIKTRKVLESVVVASILTYIIAYKGSFFVEWVNGIYTVIGGDTYVYVLLIVSIFGGLIRLLQDSGGALGFGHFASKYANTQRKSLFITFILGIIVFVDEYLNALAVTAAMRNLTDKNKVPREMLACTVNTAGTPVCAIIPFSTWGAFYIALISDSGILEGTKLTGLGMYFKSIPFMVYPFVMLVIMALLISGVIPKVGTIKKSLRESRENRGDITIRKSPC